jgi:AcrR family transcriptional regulator
MPRTAEARNDDAALSHNLLGQRLGRKGRDTRERILAAAERILADEQERFSLSAVAREASLGMTTLYLYFGDLTELMLAVLEPITASAEDAFVAQMRVRWPDATLAKECDSFVRNFYAFWQRHSRILHLRNSLASTDGDPRIVRQRIEQSSPLVRLLAMQMDGDPEDMQSLTKGFATALLTGIERSVTVTTDTEYSGAAMGQPVQNIPNLLIAQARLLELAIRDRRGA